MFEIVLESIKGFLLKTEKSFRIEIRNFGIFEVKPLKPTGAGDAFMGGFIGSLLNDYSLEESIEIGSAAAAIVVTKVGCAPAMPDFNEIKSFMNSNKIN